MNLWQTVLLAIIQGVTEFLPVSSSGHLFLANKLFGIEKPSLFFEIVLHLGTLIAVLFYYKNDIFAVIRDTYLALKFCLKKEFKKARQLDGIHLSIMVVAASIPTAFIGLGLKNYLDPDLPTAVVSVNVVAFALLINGLVLIALQKLLDSKKNHPKSLPAELQLQPKPGQGLIQGLQIKALSIQKSLIIGIAQGLAVFPGISRSGSTITAGICVGLENKEATRFSFLISIPTIIGAFLLKLLELDHHTIHSEEIPLFFLGAVVSALVGFAALSLLVEMVKKVEIRFFGYYCLTIAVIVLVFAHA